MIYLLNPYKQIQLEADETGISNFLLGPDNSGNIVYLEIIERMFGATTIHPSMLHDYGADALPSGAILLLPWSNMICEEYTESLIDILIGGRIDVIPISVGIQAPYGKSPFSLNISSDSLRLLKYASERGRTVGARGYITQSILRSYGIESIAIGCPSCYSLPLDQLEVNYTRIKNISSDEVRYAGNNTLSGSHRLETAALMKWIVDNASAYILQSESRIIADVYSARFHKDIWNPSQCSSALYRDDMNNLVFDYGFYSVEPSKWGEYREFFRQKARVFFDTERWKAHVRNYADIMVGSRFHGNTVALLSGVPALYAPFDWRTLELCSFHGLPMIHHSTYQDLYKHIVDMDAFQIADMRQKQTFSISAFKSFLLANRLEAAL